jgi:inosine-uridine nucleoside N-ribohydrolase
MEAVRNNPNEVTLMAERRLSNLALALQTAPDIITPFRMLAPVH